MEWKNIHTRHEEHKQGVLKDGAVCVCRMTGEYYYYQVDIVLCVYYKGHMYDIQCKENNIMPKEDYCMTNRDTEDGIVCLLKDYFDTGENVENIQSPVLD